MISEQRGRGVSVDEVERSRRSTEAEALLEQLSAGTFRELSREVLATDPLDFTDRLAYRARLARLQAEDPSAEAVRVGFAVIGGHDTVVVCSEYGFMAGTLGVAAGERVARAFVLATAARRPVIGICRSGGTRMQEGTPAFIKMLSIGAAISEHREAGLACLSYLMDPAMGGALAAWGTQGHLVWAEPGASIALTGPRVVEAVTAEHVPLDEISAEAALQRGLIDEIVPLDELAARATAWLDIAAPAGRAQQHAPTPQPAPTPQRTSEPLGAPKPRPTPTPQRTPEPLDAATPRDVAHPQPVHVDAWASVLRSRSGDRPSIETLIAAADSHLIEIRGDRSGRDDRGLITGFIQMRDHRVVTIGFRRPTGRGAEVEPCGYRKAHRAVAIAAELGLPLVSFIDTRGAGAGVEVESEGLADAVGTLIRELLRVRIPTVAVLVGEGAGAGAIGLLAADAIVALEHAWLAPIAPEAASAIVFRNTDEAAQMVRNQAADTASLQREGLVDMVVPEGPTVSCTSRRLVDAVAAELTAVGSLLASERLLRRRAGIRSLARQHLTIGAETSGVTPGVTR